MLPLPSLPDRSALDAVGRVALAVAPWALSVAFGMVLVELPWSDGLVAMGPLHLLANGLLVALACSIVALAGQRSRVALAAFVGGCLAVGLANAFVVQFKGQPIVPADLSALGTAASVSGGYDLLPTPRMVGCIALYGLYLVILWKLPRARRERQATRGERGARVACNAAAALLLGAAAVGLLQGESIEDRWDCKVDVWDVRGSYARQGTPLCFAERLQQLAPAQPAGYSAELAEELQAAALAALEGAPESQTLQASFDEAPAEAAEPIRPHVLAIMNETFSDLSIYPGLEGTAAATPYVSGLSERSAASGGAVVSALGGGTCNSEFEFLTGASLGNMGGGTYPYTLYDFAGAQSLPAAFRSQGYQTRAIHPAEAANWRRDQVYAQLGFDTFDDIETFKAQPGYEEALFRNLVSDRTTYDLALEMIEQAEAPQFIFDVTIQNHGGYDTGLVPVEDAVSLEGAPVSSSELDEFLGCMAASERDLAYLLERLDGLDEPVVVCFFGDHQPGFSDWLFEETFGHGVEGVPLADVQTRFTTPYFIWGNESAQAAGLAQAASQSAPTASLNYLGGLLMGACGLPQTGYLAFLEGLREAVPAINMNGYLTADGLWHWFDQDAGVSEALANYAIVQHWSLFG